MKPPRRVICTEYHYVDKIYKIFEDNGTELYFVELEADFKERIEREVELLNPGST